jgi:hypothetical protein
MALGYREPLINSQVDGTTLTAAAAATALPAAAKFTLPTNYFNAVGRAIEINLWGRLSTVVTTPGTWRLDVRFGATVVFDGLAGAFNAATNAYTTVGWHAKILLVCRTIGSTATLMGQGTFTAPNVKGGADVAMPIGGVTGMMPWNTAPAVGNTFDATATQQVDIFWTQTAATGSFTLHMYTMEGLN